MGRLCSTSANSPPIMAVFSRYGKISIARNGSGIGLHNGMITVSLLLFNSMSIWSVFITGCHMVSQIFFPLVLLTLCLLPSSTIISEQKAHIYFTEHLRDGIQF